MSKLNQGRRYKRERVTERAGEWGPLFQEGEGVDNWNSVEKVGIGEINR